MSRRARWLAPLLVVAGLGAGLLLSALAGGGWRATALVEARGADPERTARTAATLAESPAFLAGVRPQVLGGRLSTDELADRVDARVVDGTALVELRARAPARADAASLARDVAASLVAAGQGRARQDAELVEAELRTRVEALDEQLADAPAGGESERLTRQREALERRAAEAAASAAQPALVVAAAPADAERDGPLLWHGLLGGLLLGAVLATGVVLLDRPRPEERIAEPAAEAAPPPRPRLLEPAAGSVVAGVVALRADPPADGFEASADGATWVPVGAEWDTASLPDGRRLVRPHGGEPVTLVVDNTPPTVSVVEPAPNAEVGARVPLVADARDAGSGVATVGFLLSDGSPEWRAVEADDEGTWDAEELAPGTYWLCAVATDGAGHQAASEPVPVVVR